ncbi:hypothetical protein K469DRAFT_482833, partial [Zopfia rhizophila CBS 207.26]
VKSDYTRNKRKFVIRMSSDLHDTVAAEIWSDIYDRLKEVRKRTDRTSKIKFPVSNGQMDSKSPGSAFQHRDCQFPGFVMKIAWSQRKLNLLELASEYIQRSQGSIRTVVGVNLNDIYAAKMRQRRQATLGKSAATSSVWRAEVDESNGLKRVTVIESVLDKMYKDGNTVTGADLQLSLRDFTCEKVARKFQDIQDPEIVV